MQQFTVMTNSGVPLAPPEGHAGKTSHAVSSNGGVPVVLLVGSQPEVRYPVVRSIAINVVDVFTRPFACVKSPGDPMGHNLPVKRHASEVSVFAKPCRDLSIVRSALAFYQFLADTTSYFASFRIVRKTFAQFFNRYLAFPISIENHLLNPFSRLKTSIAASSNHATKIGVAAGCWGRA